MRLSDGLFLECARDIATDYPYLNVDYLPLDNLALELARDPTRYDMLVMGNLTTATSSATCAPVWLVGSDWSEEPTSATAVRSSKPSMERLPTSLARGWRTRWPSSCRQS